jgi:hypothetical protein
MDDQDIGSGNKLKDVPIYEGRSRERIDRDMFCCLRRSGITCICVPVRPSAHKSGSSFVRRGIIYAGDRPDCV